MMQITVRDALSDAIRYWEPRRILYNAALLIVVLGVYRANLPAARSGLNIDALQVLFVLAVLANVAYCAAHALDVVTQLSAFRRRWLQTRWLLLAVGVGFAAVLAHFLARGLLVHPS